MPSTDPIECVKDGYKHGHSTFVELQACVGDARLIVSVVPGTGSARGTAYGPARPVSAPVPAPATAPTIPLMRSPEGEPTDPQLRYIRNLGGGWRDAASGTKAEASALIEMLKDPEAGAAFKLPDTDLLNDDWQAFPIEHEYRQDPYAFCTKWPLRYHYLSDEEPLPDRHPTTPVIGSVYHEEEDTSKASESTKLNAALPLLEKVPEGYFAVEDEWGTVRFIRISRPVRGTWRNCVKVQTIHAERLELAWAKLRNGTCQSYTYDDIEGWILKIIIDWSRAARRYAKEIDKCCRCNTRLTDTRSRKYGIGPECEKHWPWIIDEVDQELAGSHEEGF